MKQEITNGMFLAFLVNMVYTKGIGLTQGILARQLGNDMWISTTISIIQGILVMLLVVWLIKRLPQKNILEQSEILLGKWVSKIIGVIVFFYFLGAYASVMITYVYHIKDYFSPDSPILLPIMVALIVGIYGSFKGIEVIGRYALIGLFAVFIFNIMMIFGSFGDFDIKEILPVMSSSLIENIKGSVHYNTDWGMSTMIATMILPIVTDQKVWTKSGTAGIIYGGIAVLLWPILEAGVLSPEVTSQYIVACMQLARAAEIGLFLHRYEMIMVAFFSVSLYTQIMIITYIASLVMSHTFSVKNNRTPIIPVAIVLNAFGYWVVFDHTRAMTLLTYYWPYISIAIAIGLPVTLFALGFFMKDKLNKARSSEK